MKFFPTTFSVSGLAAFRAGGSARPLTLLLLCGLAFAQEGAPAPASAPAPQGTPAQPSGQPPAQPAAPEGELPQATITLERTTRSNEKRTIEIVRQGTDETGISATCSPQDDEPDDAPTIVVYSESTSRGVRVTVDKNVIRAPLAIITKQQGGDGHIEMTAGTARYLEEAPEGKTDRLSRCEVEARPEVKSDTVNVTQGKTSLKGSKLVYDENDGVARISGPITFAREKLTGKSQRIDVDVEREVTTLVGAVEFRDGDRTSKAERVDYDDTRNVAILRGTPENLAETSTSKDTLRAETIRYNLDTGEAVVLRGEKPISGKFEDEESEAPAPAQDTP
ncbi:LptA/OstA family protein [Deinococcus peraridilitoris]|uniref:Organic solvent tolerance-like N-terminal domain-containing protein n=1 Tax=Deinococcus peraridilitoris (strain DSM 19664 / LMG 22246 / CIP 109416 / KR-200) TaxID=937777 RepID=L0A3N3_DEIPD|nr:LptA/OstA family protein [Deinococcus peraridilitoris]AFZ68461.1 hypothetical protein Deipe_3011 [Deinococcus peraridilitoris DSM 19664]